MIVNEDNARDTEEFLTKRLSAIKNQRSTGELEDLALIIGNIHQHLYPFFSGLINSQMERVLDLHSKKTSRRYS